METKKTSKAGRAALDRLLNVNFAGSDIHLVLASLVDDDMPDFQRVVISKGVAKEFRNLAQRVFDRLRADLESQRLVVYDYDPATLLAHHQVECMDLAENKQVASQIRAMGDPKKLDTFDGDGHFITNLRFYVLAFMPKSGPRVKLFRFYTQKKELSRSVLFAITRRGGQYDAVTDSTFLFDQHIDCLAVGNSMLILKKDSFQKIFRYYEKMVETAKKTLDTIEKHIPIDNFNAFAAACEGHLVKLAKLKNISRKPYLPKLTIADLKKVIVEFELDIDTVGSGEEERLKYDPANQWAILNLLNDDYLESIMTKLKYWAEDKRPL